MSVVPRMVVAMSMAIGVGVGSVSGQNALQPPTKRADSHEFFETRIRPVLVEHCYACHNSEESAEGDLAVDSREGLRRGGTTGDLIVPGDVKRSRLVAILKHQVEGLEMPQDGPKLDASVIADFERWIADGAADPRDEPPSKGDLSEMTSWDATLRRRKQWWCFQPIRDPDVPIVPGDATHPIDRFIDRKLNESKLQASPPADPTTLIRRLYITLIGLPPTPDEVTRWQDRFRQAADQQRDVVADQLVDELLSSDHFGERWARHWMDWIRYAESHGSEGDPAIEGAWMYRDYLIRALNRDVPYDQLVREHVAGDLLNEPRLNEELGINESMIGPAHWRMVFHGFAPTDALDEKVRFVDDQVNAFSKAFLGLTVSCARCHDHKFDAISQKDYYALFGILASCRPARSVIDTVQRQDQGVSKLVALKNRIREELADAWIAGRDDRRNRLQALLDSEESREFEGTFVASLRQCQKSIDGGTTAEEAWRSVEGKWIEATLFEKESVLRRWDLTNQDDAASWNRAGNGLSLDREDAGNFSIAPEGDQVLRGIYPDGIYSHLVSDKHAARLTSEDLDLDEPSEIWVHAIGDRGAAYRYVVQDYPRNGTVYPVTDLTPRWIWHRLDLDYWTGDQVHVELTTAKDAPLLVRDLDHSWFGIREAVLTKKGSPPPTVGVTWAGAVRAARKATPTTSAEIIELLLDAISGSVERFGEGRPSAADAVLLDDCLRLGMLENNQYGLPRVSELVSQYRQIENAVSEIRRVPGLEETSGREQPLFVRGDHRKPGEAVPRRFLEAIDATPYPTSSSGRLALAKDLLRDDNPLTRRVIVNRLWHHLFGRGLVATPDNFGKLGQQPSHPELLDWLATRFDADGWSIKKMIRLIVTSRAWKRSSVPHAKAREIDPTNRYLSHARLRRMEAEVIRDTLWSVSGGLDRTLYGPPVDGGSPRRSVYMRVIRNSLDPFLRSFDFPEPFSTTGRRDVTNVPAQSLTLMNDRTVASRAGKLVDRIFSDPQVKDERQRVEQMFLTTLSRKPTNEELTRAENYLHVVRGQVVEVERRRERIEKDLAAARRNIDEILSPVRTRLKGEAEAKLAAGSGESAVVVGLPAPIAHWDFETDLTDKVGDANGSLVGNGRVEEGFLITDGSSYVVTAPLRQELNEKTLAAWVRVRDLEQRGGGVMSVQTADGVVFDAIVFAEQESRRWLAGSNGFVRTQSLQGPEETEATDRPVHFAIVYHADGTITAFRDGRPYGKGYRRLGPIRYEAGKTVVTFGLRHLPAGGNRYLAAEIDEAMLYDQALSDEQVAATASLRAHSVSEADVLAALSDDARSRVASARDSIREWETSLQALNAANVGSGPRAAWADLARAIFTFQEFIYVR